MNKKMIFLAIIFFATNALVAMDEIVPLPSNDLVFDVVFSNYLVDHEAVCSFAATNKVYNQRILATAPQRKKLLQNKMGCFQGKLSALWHKYGSAYCVACACTDTKILSLEYNKAAGCDNSDYKEIIVCFRHNFENFKHPLPHKPTLFFNNEGVLCFYGYGSKEIPQFSYTVAGTLFIPYPGIIRYQLDGTYLRCMVRKKIWCTILHFFEYPILLKAILDSSLVNIFKKIEFEEEEECLGFSIEGVTIPDNYQERTPFDAMSVYCKHDSFDKFPDELRQLIMQRYDEQNKK